MGLMPIYFNAYRITKPTKKKTVSVSLLTAKIEHAKFLNSIGVRGRKAMLTMERARFDFMETKLAPLSNVVPAGVAAKRSILTDHEWRRDSGESVETIGSIYEKASRAMPLYNKGGYQLVSKNEDPSMLGSRSRR